MGNFGISDFYSGFLIQHTTYMNRLIKLSVTEDYITTNVN